MKYINPVLWATCYCVAIYTFRDFLPIYDGYEYLAYYLLGIPAMLPLACLAAYAYVHNLNKNCDTPHPKEELLGILLDATVAFCIMWPAVIIVILGALSIWTVVDILIVVLYATLWFCGLSLEQDAEPTKEIHPNAQTP